MSIKRSFWITEGNGFVANMIQAPTVTDAVSIAPTGANVVEAKPGQRLVYKALNGQFVNGKLAAIPILPSMLQVSEGDDISQTRFIPTIQVKRILNRGEVHEKISV